VIEYIANDLQKGGTLKEARLRLHNVLAERQVRRTTPRQQVLDAFLSTHLPMTVAEVHRRLRNRRINLVSVYRAIHLFCRLGMLTAVDQVAEGRRYELSDDHRAHHHHLICERCGDIQDFEECSLDTLERRIRRRMEFRITRHELRFFGLCHSCAA
jgi:Fur family ferric uptake transcriptional regulator